MNRTRANSSRIIRLGNDNPGHEGIVFEAFRLGRKYATEHDPQTPASNRIYRISGPMGQHAEFLAPFMPEYVGPVALRIGEQYPYRQVIGTTLAGSAFLLGSYHASGAEIDHNRLNWIEDFNAEHLAIPNTDPDHMFTVDSVNFATHDSVGSDENA